MSLRQDYLSNNTRRDFLEDACFRLLIFYFTSFTRCLFCILFCIPHTFPVSLDIQPVPGLVWQVVYILPYFLMVCPMPHQLFSLKPTQMQVSGNDSDALCTHTYHDSVLQSMCNYTLTTRQVLVLTFLFCVLARQSFCLSSCCQS